MSDIVEVLAFFVSTGLLPTLAVGLIGSVAATGVAVRRGWFDTSASLAFAAVLSAMGVLVFTLFREGVLIVGEVAAGAPLVFPGWQGLRAWAPDGWWRATADPLSSPQVMLNIALFVPAGFLWTIVTRRPWGVLAALSGLSVAIESIQAVSGLGANDLADIIANLAGAALGTGAAVLAGWAADATGARTVRTRRWVLRAMTVATVGLCAVVVPGLGATARQAALTEEALDSFQGTSLPEIHRWARDEEMDRVWRGVPSTYSDGFVLGQQSATARYPARFLGQRTCILVTWDAVGFEVRPAAGTVCQQTSL